MKNNILLIVLLVTGSIFGQSKLKKADQLFDRMWYKEAAEIYAEALEKDTEDMELLQKAGDAYFYNTDMKNANKWYDILIGDFEDEVAPEYLFRYAHSLEGIGKYREAKRWMKKFADKTNQKETRQEAFSQKQKTLENVLNIEPAFYLKNVSVNTKHSDFGPMYYKNELVYSSAIDSSNYHTRIYHWNEQPFLNMYLGKLNASKSDVKFIENFSKVLNTKYHEATLAFSPDEQTVYFTRNNYESKLGRDKNGTNHLKLYRAELTNGKDSTKVWSNVKELPFNSDDYSVGHPTVSKDGKQLYFVSDMPGSIGATDIFVVDIIESNDNNIDEDGNPIEEETYSSPKNLGPTINTAGREMFPYFTETALYFASDGHLGLGGLDVFQSNISNESFEKPYNLGAPLNSELDDFAFIIDPETQTGFVCSNRKQGKGDDDIYSFTRIETENNPIACEQLVYGFISNTVTGERISAVEVTLVDAENKILESTFTDINGDYRFNTVLGCETPYQVKAKKTGYTPKEKGLKTKNESGETIVPLGLETVNELIVEQNGQLKIKIGIIYFDLDKSYIRANDAAIELNKIVLLMTEYPDMVIKIESHTDSRAKDAYNLALSDRRAKSTKAYFVSQGIAENRIESAIGYGETKLINNCVNGVPCTEAQHQFNRRSEFIIIKM